MKVLSVVAHPPTGGHRTSIVALADAASRYTIETTPVPVAYATTATKTPGLGASRPLAHHGLAMTREGRAPTAHCATSVNADDRRMQCSISGMT